MNTDTLLQWRECEILYYTKYLTGCCMSHGKCISVYLLCTTKLLGPKLEALTSVEYGRGYCKHLTNDCQINPKCSVLHGFLLWKWSRLLLLAQVVLQSYKYLWKGIKIYNILPEVFSHPCKSLNSGVPNTFVAAFRRVQITEWGFDIFRGGIVLGKACWLWSFQVGAKEERQNQSSIYDI